ncbi:MAG: branched-chain amino acid ABC transporter substrate-binding protein [Burkholderiales bacterium]|nr:branched-chain amino acid ABC transporter substrate-binding protein [Burkholderiales bacterium]
MTLLRRTVHTLAITALAATAGLAAAPAWAQKGETVKIAWIDGMSGPFANIGNNMIRTFQFLSAREANNAAGVKFEIVPFDSKGSPQESLVVLKAALDQGIRYIAQGNSSAIAGALLDAINKHNERNPGKEVVFFNYAAVDPDLTNSKCSFWHFRFDADTSMKMEAMTTFMKDDKSVKKVYLINQNYAHGQQVAKFAKEGLARKRPDVQIVGEDLHPIGQVKDFAPYVAKAKAAGADTVITGNWGNDMSLLIKAAKDAGFSANFYTYYAGAAGTPTVIGNAMEGKVKVVYGSYANLPGDHQKVLADFRKKYNEDYSLSTTYHLFKLLPAAMAKAKSTDPVKVAFAMEGLTVSSFSGDVTMRKSDHQLQQTLYQATWRKKDAKNSFDVEGTGMTWVAERTFEPYVSSTPTTCDMKRPAGGG